LGSGGLEIFLQLCYTRTNDDTTEDTMKRDTKEYVKPRGHYVLNQKCAVFADRRTKRQRTRGAAKREAMRLAS
jgi:hypothetical protein